MDYKINTACSTNLHPLLINHIAENILEYEAFENPSTMLSTRKVCEQWNQISTRLYQQHSKELITFGKSFNHPSSIVEFTTLLENSVIFPFVNFRLCQDVFSPRHEAFIRDFFGKCSPFLTSLIIRLDQQSNLEIPNNWLPKLKLRQLKSLVYDDRRNTVSAFDGNLLRILLSSSKNNLQTLSLHRKDVDINSSLETDVEYIELMNRLDTTLSSVQMKNLYNLQVELKLNDKLILSITKNLPGLRNLSLSMKSPAFSPESLYNLLESQRDTLQKLKLSGFCKRTEISFHFPKMECLNSLEIHGWCHHLPYVKFPNLTMHENFPNLTELIMNTWSDDESWKRFYQNFNQREIKNQNLTKLKLPQELFNPQVIFDISRTFNHLRVLQLYFVTVGESTAIFIPIFQKLYQLEELKILKSFREFSCRQNLDTVLTGLSSDTCQRLGRKSFIVPERLKRLLNISLSVLNLTNLKVLDLVDILQYQATISDITGYAILSLMRNLKHLKISRSELSQKCLSDLYSRFPDDLQHEFCKSNTNSPEKDSGNIKKFSISLNSCNII